jgi:aryl-alcohol dehydrogenase-like predicted oxidoreductase
MHHFEKEGVTMSQPRSRREFIAAGLALPVAAEATLQSPPEALPAAASNDAGAPIVRKRTLGRTGLEVSEVGFGCMITSDASVITRAADLGINYFDTARVYQGGNNERLVGAALKGHRDRIVLSTKAKGATAEEVRAELDESLRQLGTDHVDIWYLHARSRGEEITDDLREAQEKAREEGKIRFAGVSTHKGHAEVIPAAIEKKVDVVLMSYNFTMGDSMEPLLASLHEAGVGVVAMKTQAGGRGAEEKARFDRLVASGGMLAALKWALRTPNVQTTVPSITDMAMLDENIRAMAAPLTPEEQAVLTARLEVLRPDYCSMCGECEGTCPKGLPVADVLRFLTYAEGYGQFALGREGFLSLPRSLQEVRCDDCPSCPVPCSRGVEVARRLRRAQELLA